MLSGCYGSYNVARVLLGGYCGIPGDCSGVAIAMVFQVVARMLLGQFKHIPGVAWELLGCCFCMTGGC